MIISDLQHIESATETLVQGGKKKPNRPTYKPTYVAYSIKIAPTEELKPSGISFAPLTYNAAGAEAGAEAVGSNTQTFTTTDTSVIQGQFSYSSSSSFSEAC